MKICGSFAKKGKTKQKSLKITCGLFCFWKVICEGEVSARVMIHNLKEATTTMQNLNLRVESLGIPNTFDNCLFLPARKLQIFFALIYL